MKTFNADFSDHLKNLAEQFGVEFKQCTDFHIRLKALHSVDVYESRGTYYVNGMNKSKKFSSTLFLVKLAKGETELENANQKVKRERLPYAQKVEQWKKNSICFFCSEKILTPEEATWEHKIPLVKGGSNRKDNLELSHAHCNRTRGESIGVKQMDEITINPAMATSVIILDTTTGQSDYLDLTQDNLPKIIEYFTRIEELANS